MPGTAPALDARTLAELLEQLLEQTQARLPGWTPPADGDAGTALHQVFARFVQIALQRLNGMPDKTLLSFLDTMGISQLPPAPARVPLVFGLAPGAAPTLVPAGTQVGAPAADGRPEVVFATGQDLLVLPARLAAAHTVDPVWDRTSDLADLLTAPGPAAAAPGPARHRAAFVGDTPLAHALYVSGDPVLSVDRDTACILAFGYRSSAPRAELLAFFGSLQVSCVSAGRPRTVPLTAAVGDDVVYFEGTVPPVEATVLSGAGLDQPVTGGWLRMALPAPLPDAGVPADLLLRPELLDAAAGDLLPDAVLAGTTAIDPTRDFLPFGARPQLGDALLIRSDQAFAQPRLASVSIRVGAGTPAAGTALIWEYLGTDGWAEVPAVQADQPGTGTLTGTGVVGLTLPPVPVRQLAGHSGRWIRVRLAAGGYGAPAEYEPVDADNPGQGFRVKAGTGNLAPPRLQSLRLSYTARAVPRCVVQVGDHCQQPAGEFSPFPGPARLPEPYADPEPALYLGFDDLAPQQPVTLYVDVPAPEFARPGLPAADPAAADAAAGLRWEYHDGLRWRELTVFDGTGAFTVAGMISLVTPPDLAQLARFDQVPRTWLRVRSAGNDPLASPRLGGLYVNAVRAAAAVPVAGEVLGSGSGQPGQSLRTARQPVQPGQELLVAEPERVPDDEAQALAAEEGPDATRTRPAGPDGRIWVRWHEVPNLVRSGPKSRHYTVDRATGTVHFGDGLRGMIPPPGTANLVIDYRAGGGAAGNVPPASAVQLRTPVPGITSVGNPVAADGGADLEPLAAVRDRGARVVRHRDRAIAAADVEWLARQATGTRIARAVCLSNVDDAFAPNPGWLSVLVVPAGVAATPRPTAELVREVGAYLAERSAVPLTGPGPVKINVVGPAYLRVAVDTDIVPRNLADADGVKQRIAAALGDFFHPVTGGPDRCGWTLGRPVYISEVAQLLASVPGVSHVQTLALEPNQAQTRLTLAGPPAVAPVRFPAGSPVRTADDRHGGLLAAPVPAGTPLRRLDVTGLREGDRITLAVDLTVPPGSDPTGTLSAGIAAGTLVTGFPRGSVVVAADGRRQTRLRRGIRPVTGPDGQPGGGVEVELADPLPAAAGDRITVLWPFPATVVGVRPDAAGTLAVTVLPTPAAGPLPAGSIVSTVDARVRGPLAVDHPAGPDGTLTRLLLSDFPAGRGIRLRRPGSPDPVLTADVGGVDVVSDHVHLEPYVFAYSTGHRIRIVAS